MLWQQPAATASEPPRRGWSLQHLSCPLHLPTLPWQQVSYHTSVFCFTLFRSCPCLTRKVRIIIIKSNALSISLIFYFCPRNSYPHELVKKDQLNYCETWNFYHHPTHILYFLFFTQGHIYRWLHHTAASTISINMIVWRTGHLSLTVFLWHSHSLDYKLNYLNYKCNCCLFLRSQLSEPSGWREEEETEDISVQLHWASTVHGAGCCGTGESVNALGYSINMLLNYIIIIMAVGSVDWQQLMHSIYEVILPTLGQGSFYLNKYNKIKEIVFFLLWDK